MISEFFEYLTNNINWFDVVVSVIIVYSIIECYSKGFSLSLMSFMKWIFSIVVTIIMVPKLQPWVSDYVKSQFLNDVGIGVVIFISTLFLTIVMGKALSRAVTWTGVGSIDKTFGLFFGIFKGYVVSVCLFSILNWFYPYQNWGISTDESISFNFVKKGSEVLVEEFPSGEDFKDTKEKIEKI